MKFKYCNRCLQMTPHKKDETVWFARVIETNKTVNVTKTRNGDYKLKDRNIIYKKDDIKILHLSPIFNQEKCSICKK